MSAVPAPFETTLRVTPEDIDALGHVNNVVYLRWVQQAATAHWRALAPAADQERTVWVVLRHEIDYRKAARPGDEIVARTWVGASNRLSFERHTEILRAAGRELLARARTLWCPVDARTGKPMPTSQEVRQLFSSARAPLGSGAPFLREAFPEDAGAIAELLHELGHPLPEGRLALQVRRLAESGIDSFVVVALADGRVVGVSSGFATPVLHRGEPVGRLSVLVVARSHAGRGLGSMLLRDAEERFRAHGCVRVELTSAAHRTDAHEFYRRKGYAQQGVRMARDLSPDTP